MYNMFQKLLNGLICSYPQLKQIHKYNIFYYINVIKPKGPQ